MAGCLSQRTQHAPRRAAIWLGAAVLVCALAGCSTPEPTRITTTGKLPTGPDARFVLVDGAGDATLLPAPAIAACLTGAGLKADAKPALAVQAAVAVRAAASAVRFGAEADGPPPVAKGRKPRGERITYVLRIDRLGDGANVYELHVNAQHDGKRSTAESRAALLCAALAGTVAGQP